MLTIEEVAHRVFNKSTAGIYLDIRKGLLCPQIKVGERGSRLIRDEVNAVYQARVMGKSNNDIKTLVKELVAQRQTEGSNSVV